MKILMACGHLYPAQVGGPGMSVYWLARGLTDSGLSIKLVSTDWGISEQGPPKGVWHDAPCGRVNYTKACYHQLPFAMIREGLKLISESDIVQLNGLLHPASLVLASEAARQGKPIVWSIHGGLDPSALAFSPIRKKVLLAYIKKWLADKVVFRSTCPKETELAKHTFGHSSRVLELPIFMPFQEPVKISSERERYLLFIGRIHPIKAIDRLIEALPLSKRFFESEAKLYVVGDDANKYGRQLQSQVKKLAVEDRVKFLGHLEDAEKDHVLANAHWAYLPSHTENMGIVVLEGLAQGTPYTTSTGTPWTVLNERNIGYCIDNSPESLAENLDKVLSLSNSDYEQVSQECIRFARNEFGMKQNIGKWIDFYQSLLAKK